MHGAPAEAVPGAPSGAPAGTPPVDCIRLHGQDCEPRTICVTEMCPTAMQRPSTWLLDDFVLTKQLYKGKASILFQATCRRSGTMVALKFYRKHKLSPLNWYQVEREIRIHSQLQHPHIVQLYAAFEDGRHVYMVQEYALGGDLYQELKRSGGRFSEQYTVTQLLQPFLQAVVYLHDRGIIHRDIKPENILLTADKVVKLADFGLSISWTQERPVTRAGTLDYMAPEVLMCPEKTRPEENKEKLLLGYNCMVDCWAAGVLAFELLTGKPPFEQETRESTCEHIMYHKPQYPDWLPEDAKSFISTALSKTARKRPAAQDLLTHPWLLRHLHPQPPPRTGSASRPTSARTTSRPASANHTAHAQASSEVSSSTQATDTSHSSARPQSARSRFGPQQGPQGPPEGPADPSAEPTLATTKSMPRKKSVLSTEAASIAEASSTETASPGGEGGGSGSLRGFLRTASSTMKNLLNNPVGTLKAILEPGADWCAVAAATSPTTSTTQEVPAGPHEGAPGVAPAPTPAPQRDHVQQGLVKKGSGRFEIQVDATGRALQEGSGHAGPPGAPQQPQQQPDILVVEHSGASTQSAKHKPHKSGSSSSSAAAAGGPEGAPAGHISEARSAASPGAGRTSAGRVSGVKSLRRKASAEAGSRHRTRRSHHRPPSASKLAAPASAAANTSAMTDIADAKQAASLTPQRSSRSIASKSFTKSRHAVATTEAAYSAGSSQASSSTSGAPPKTPATVRTATSAKKVSVVDFGFGQPHTPQSTASPQIKAHHPHHHTSAWPSAELLEAGYKTSDSQGSRNISQIVKHLVARAAETYQDSEMLMKYEQDGSPLHPAQLAAAHASRPKTASGVNTGVTLTLPSHQNPSGNIPPYPIHQSASAHSLSALAVGTHSTPLTSPLKPGGPVLPAGASFGAPEGPLGPAAWMKGRIDALRRDGDSKKNKGFHAGPLGPRGKGPEMEQVAPRSISFPSAHQMQ